MAAPTLTLRKLFEDRLAVLLDEAETLVGEARELARLECAAELNQAVRRIRQAASQEELWSTVADVAAQFSGGAALLCLGGDNARVEKVRGAELAGVIEVSLAAAPALAGAVASKDPVIAAAVASEVSAPLFDLLGQTSCDRVSIFPVVRRDTVVALIYAWGAVEAAAVELLAQAAGAGWIEPEPELPPPPPPAPMPPPPVTEPAPATPLVTLQPAARAWDNLTAAEQQVHLRAQRHARVQVSEMRLFHSDEVQAGRSRRDLYGSLRTQIDTARESFRQKFFANCPSMVDYLHLEMLRTLANDDAELLGKDYPGPLV